jgi:nucleoside-diphosphate-sugar epimerase
MKILLLGGTRFAGRAVAARLLRDGHAVTISSRRPEGAPPGVRVLAGERPAVLAGLSASAGLDLILDFTAYDEPAVGAALGACPDAAYVLISSTWLTKFNPGLAVDAPVHGDAPSTLPQVTQRYLTGKARAEGAVLAARELGRAAGVLRLPIMGGADDHTGRLDFYRRRLVDGGPLLLVNGGTNTANLVWCEDVADAIAGALSRERLWRAPILDGLPDSGQTVGAVLAALAEAEDVPLRSRAAAADWLQADLPAYLEQEPLWREHAVTPGRANLFALSGHRPHDLREWLAAICAGRPPRPETDGLRARELALLDALAVA